MEKKISRLFDYQKYEQNASLREVTNDVEKRHPDGLRPMSDEELGMLSAAGNVNAQNIKKLMDQK